VTIPSLIPRLEILPEAQRRIWARLTPIPEEFILCGGTAIALQLGYRQSVDFDFFAISSMRRVAAPSVARDNGLRVASLLDLAGMKAAVVQQRAEAKD
jgi:hypothetical protein